MERDFSQTEYDSAVPCMDRLQRHTDMEQLNQAEYLKELNQIIETQQEVLDKQNVRIEELEQQVMDLCSEISCLTEQHERHLVTCRVQLGNNHPELTVGDTKEKVSKEK
ncbi:hypothetical protein DPEC_G00248880 [Dallia pectoralis]|uniref:Uncharacterized protein n=1 Tax=Dallia pectoralis TaxID=75939 RepID=A0ACC2FSP4_DALPE|nr:hypothetical protein DPEC_G00248880 [Dallia pectoralis]